MTTPVRKTAICYGQKFGHDFRTAGGNCSKCGINQGELSRGLTKIEYFVKKPEHGIHSEKHALAKEISEYCKEPKKFGMYLGIIKNISLPRAYKIFAEIKQGKEVETPGKLFVYLSAHEPRERREVVGNGKKKNNKYIKRGRKPRTNFASRGKRSAAPKRVGPIRPSRSARK